MNVQAGLTGGEATEDVSSAGEYVIATLAAEDGEFRMTPSTLVFVGGSEAASIYASALLSDVTGVEILRRPRESRSAWWGGIGLVAAVGVWEVASNGVVGGVAAVLVALISLALLADYWFRPGGAIVAFRTPGSSVQGVVSSTDLPAARQFVDEFEEARLWASRWAYGPTAGYGSF